MVIFALQSSCHAATLVPLRRCLCNQAARGYGQNSVLTNRLAGERERVDKFTVIIFFPKVPSDWGSRWHVGGKQKVGREESRYVPQATVA